MKRRAGRVLCALAAAVAVCLAAGSAPGSGEVADIECATNTAVSAGLTFKVTGEGGGVLQVTEVTNASIAACSISVRLREGEIVSVTADTGKVYNLTIDGPCASFQWTGAARDEAEIEIATTIAASAPTPTALPEAVLTGASAEIRCERSAAETAGLSFTVRDVTGTILQQGEVADASALGSAVTVRLSSGEVLGVSADGGSVRDLQISGAAASFVWEGPPGDGAEIRITVQGAAGTETAHIFISESEALKLLHTAGVRIDEKVSVTGAAIGGVQLARTSEGFEGEGEAEGVLSLSYRTASGQGSMALSSFAFEESDGAVRVTSGGRACLVEYLNSGVRVYLRAVDAGGALGALPEAPPLADGELFTGWYGGGSAVTAATRVYTDTQLEAGHAKVTAHEGETVRISNEGGALTAALGEDVKPETVKVRLEGAGGSGNEGYYANGWSEDGAYYVVHNCESISDADAAYTNAHVPLSELRGVTLCGTAGGRTVSVYIAADELDISGGVVTLKQTDGEAQLQLAVGEVFAYMDGRSETEFAPEEGITRAEAASIFYRCLTAASRASLVERSVFADVSAYAWYCEAVSALAGAGILDGRGEMRFAPEEGITRAEFVVLAMRILGEGERLGADRFTDVSGSWARGYINAAYELGIIGGYPDGTFRPNAGISRAEAASIMNALLGRSADTAALPSATTWQDVPVTAWYYKDVILATAA